MAEEKRLMDAGTLFPVSLPGIFTEHFLHEKEKHARKIQAHTENPLLTQATYTHTTHKHPRKHRGTHIWREISGFKGWPLASLEPQVAH